MKILRWGQRNSRANVPSPRHLLKKFWKWFYNNKKGETKRIQRANVVATDEKNQVQNPRAFFEFSISWHEIVTVFSWFCHFKTWNCHEKFQKDSVTISFLIFPFHDMTFTHHDMTLHNMTWNSHIMTWNCHKTAFMTWNCHTKTWNFSTE